MKKILVVLAVLIMALAMVGCGGDESPDDGSKSPTKANKSEFKVGDTWEVDGEWKLIIKSVSATDDRNEFSDKKPGAVYLLDYTYENLGYKDSSGIMDGLYMSIDDAIVDAKGKMGYPYPGDTNAYPQETPEGAVCDAQACIGVENPGDFKLTITQYDSKSNKQTATFNIKVQ